jgi:GTPase SAR1 family protein
MEFERAAAFAAETGGTECRLSRIIIVGEGRVGKTALFNALMGRKFEKPDSTVGITEGIFKVDRAGVQVS